MDLWQLILALFGALALLLFVWRALAQPRLALALFVLTITITRTLTGKLDAEEWSSRLTGSEVVGGLLLLSWLLTRLRAQRRAKRTMTGFLAVWLLFLIFASFSLVWFRGGLYNLGISELLAVWYLSLVYYVVDDLIATPDDLRGLLSVWLMTAGILFAAGCCDILSLLVFHHHWLPWEDPQDLYRVRLTFRNGAQLGAYTLVTFFIILGYASFPGVGRTRRRLACGLAVVACVILFFSSKRSAWVGAAAGLLTLLGYVVRLRGLPKKFILIPILGLGVIVGLVRYSAGLEQFTGWRMEIFHWPEMEQNEFLQENWGGAVEAFLEHWAVGIGFGGFERSAYDPGGYEIHSTPLRVLAETGLVGFLIFCLAQFLMLKAIYTTATSKSMAEWRLPAACLFSGLVAVGVSSIYHIHFRNREYWLMLAVITSLHRIAGASRPRSAAHREDQLAVGMAAAGGRLQSAPGGPT